MLDAVSQEVQAVLKCSAALAVVGALTPVPVPVADGEGRLPQDGAALPARVGSLQAPARVQPFHQGDVVAAVLKQSQNGGHWWGYDF